MLKFMIILIVVTLNIYYSEAVVANIQKLTSTTEEDGSGSIPKHYSVTGPNSIQSVPVTTSNLGTERLSSDLYGIPLFTENSNNRQVFPTRNTVESSVPSELNDGTYSRRISPNESAEDDDSSFEDPEEQYDLNVDDVVGPSNFGERIPDTPTLTKAENVVRPTKPSSKTVRPPSPSRIPSNQRPINTYNHLSTTSPPSTPTRNVQIISGHNPVRNRATASHVVNPVSQSGSTRNSGEKYIVVAIPVNKEKPNLNTKTIPTRTSQSTVPRLRANLPDNISGNYPVQLGRVTRPVVPSSADNHDNGYPGGIPNARPASAYPDIVSRPVLNTVTKFTQNIPIPRPTISSSLDSSSNAYKYGPPNTRPIITTSVDDITDGHTRGVPSVGPASASPAVVSSPVVNTVTKYTQNIPIPRPTVSNSVDSTSNAYRYGAPFTRPIILTSAGDNTHGNTENYPIARPSISNPVDGTSNRYTQPIGPARPSVSSSVDNNYPWRTQNIHTVRPIISSPVDNTANEETFIAPSNRPTSINVSGQPTGSYVSSTLDSAGVRYTQPTSTAIPSVSSAVDITGTRYSQALSTQSASNLVDNNSGTNNRPGIQIAQQTISNVKDNNGPLYTQSTPTKTLYIKSSVGNAYSQYPQSISIAKPSASLSLDTSGTRYTQNIPSIRTSVSGLEGNIPTTYQQFNPTGTYLSGSSANTAAGYSQPLPKGITTASTTGGNSFTQSNLPKVPNTSSPQNSFTNANVLYVLTDPNPDSQLSNIAESDYKETATEASRDANSNRNGAKLLNSGYSLFVPQQANTISVSGQRYAGQVRPVVSNTANIPIPTKSIEGGIPNFRNFNAGKNVNNLLVQGNYNSPLPVNNNDASLVGGKYVIQRPETNYPGEYQPSISSNKLSSNPFLANINYKNPATVSHPTGGASRWIPMPKGSNYDLSGSSSRQDIVYLAADEVYRSLPNSPTTVARPTNNDRSNQLTVQRRPSGPASETQRTLSRPTIKIPTIRIPQPPKVRIRLNRPNRPRDGNLSRLQ